jgi:hypothetical protein
LKQSFFIFGLHFPASRVFYSVMKQNKQNKATADLLARLKAGGAGVASTTKGRARTFKNRKKEAARKACRKPI